MPSSRDTERAYWIGSDTLHFAMALGLLVMAEALFLPGARKPVSALDTVPKVAVDMTWTGDVPIEFRVSNATTAVGVTSVTRICQPVSPLIWSPAP